MTDHQKLTDTINEVWQAAYGGEPVTDLLALQTRIRGLADDRNCWLFNYKVLHKAYNEMDAKTTATSEQFGS
jgi:hypothetical protein